MKFHSTKCIASIALSFIFLSILNISYAQTQLGNTLLGTEKYDGTGDALALDGDGNRVIYSANLAEKNDLKRVGEAKVYELQNGTWMQLGATITGSDEGEQLGKSVDISEDGSRIAVAGKLGVRVYDFDNGNWSLNYDYAIFPDFNAGNNGAKRVRFADNGKKLIVAGENFTSDIIVVYNENNGIWSKMGNDISFDSSVKYFAVTKNGNRLAVPKGFEIRFTSGSFGYYSNMNIFDFENNNWVKNHTIVIVDSAEIAANDARDMVLSDGFDFSADGKRLVALISNDDVVDEQGFIRTFDLVNDSWVENVAAQEILMDNPYGATLRLSDDGTVAAVGIVDDVWSEQPNYATVFQFKDQQWNEVGSRFTGSGSDEYANNFVDISGDGSIVAWGGKVNTPTDSLGTIKIYNYDSVLPVNENSLSQNAIMIYPNPSTDFIYIDYASETSYNVNLTNINGQILKNIKDMRGEIQIDMNELKNGIYFLTVYTDDLKNRTTKKILKVAN